MAKTAPRGASPHLAGLLASWPKSSTSWTERHLSGLSASRAGPSTGPVHKLQRNADLLYRAESVPSGKRGRPRKCHGKVDLHDLQRWTLEHQDRRERVFTLAVYAPRFARDLRGVVAQRLDKMGRVQSQAVLCSTDVSMTAEEVQRLYAARFEADRPGRRPAPRGAVWPGRCRSDQDVLLLGQDASRPARCGEAPRGAVFAKTPFCSRQCRSV